MKSLRVIGQNIQLQMNSKGYSIEELADRLGYSVLEVHRIIEGNLSVPLQTMKKIGIITMHHVDNLGSILQSYALQHKIELMGYNAKIIDYRQHLQKQRKGLLQIFAL